MDPFLPGEIPVMVLRYLAANQCTASAMKLIDEMPKMADYIPAKPANVSEKGYLKHLLRSSVNRGLKDVLWDYGSSRILVEDMLDTDEDNDLSSSFTSDTLLSKIEILQKMLEKLSKSSSSGSNCKSPPTQSDNDRRPKPSAVTVTVDSYSNTEDYECPKCSAKRLEVKSTSESGCQTEEYTAVQFGINDKDDITMIFCKKLLDDNNLQQKISDTINEHMLDPHNKQNKDFLQKVSSKAESEIDKFLVELLQDMPEDDCSNSLQSDIGLLSNGSNVLAGPSSFAEIEKNLSAMFKDTEIMQGNSNSSGAVNQTHDRPEPSHKLVLHTPTSDPAQPTCSTRALVNMLVETPSPNSRSNDRAADVTPESSTDARTRVDSESSSVSNRTPKRSQRHAVKRITPTPLASAKANPVFNTSVVVENKTLDMGEKCTKVAVVTRNIETPAWQKLNRRSIAPKIPAGAQPKVIDNVTVRKLTTHEEKVIKIGDDVTKHKDKNQSDDVILVSHSRSASTADANGRSSAVNKTLTVALIQENQPSAHKRKATPVKLTPEKAKNTELNFMLMYQNSNSSKKAVTVPKSNDAETSANNVNADSAIKKTPLPISHVSTSKNLTSASSISSKLGLLTENSQPDVTPMQPIPEESDYPTSDLNTISPNALQRLIASASKAGNTAAVARFSHKRKSYSTPRKRKHVRSLTFASPPSVKAVTPGDLMMEERSVAQKRKATEDLFSAELRSKKRLNWPASAEKSGCVEKRGPPQKLGSGGKSGVAEKPGFAFADKAGFAFAEKPGIAETFASVGKVGLAEIPGFGEKAVVAKERGFSEKRRRAGKNRVVEVPRATEATGIPPNTEMAEPPGLNEQSTRVETLGIAETPILTEKPVNSVNADKLESAKVPNPTEKPGGVEKLVVVEIPRITEKPSVNDRNGFTGNSRKSDKAGVTEKSASVDKHGATKKSKLSEKLVDKPTIAESPELTEKPGFSHKITFSEKHGFSEKTDDNAMNEPGFSNSNKPAESSLSTSDQSPVEPEYEHKKRRARTKKTPVTKKPAKPKVTLKLTAKDLFGESPCKPKNLPPSKRSPDVIAAQAVADQAVPLGQPRENVRNYHITPLVTDGSFQTPFKGIGSSPPSNETPLNRVVAPEPSVVLPPVVIHPPPEQVEASEPEPPILQIQESANTTFNIVPAPLGFPEPTPVKFTYEVGGCKHSNNGFNSPLITPFKKAPPPNLNETQFTLPPTPRMVFEDPDSNSNSMHSLKYSFPPDLWTSTPMKQGVPRTPGRAQSSSSNSHSPILPVRSAVVTQVTNLQLPPSTTVLSLVPVTSSVITQPNATPPAPSPRKIVLSSPDMDNSEQKSEGELSSSSEEDSNITSKPAVKTPKSPRKPKPPQDDNTKGRRQPPPLLHLPPQQSHVSEESRGNPQGLQSQNRPVHAHHPHVRAEAVVVVHSQAPQPPNRPEQHLPVRDNATVHSQQPPGLQNGAQQPQATTSNAVEYSQPPSFKKSLIRKAHQPPAPSSTPYQQTQVTQSKPPVILTRPHQQLQIRDGVVRHPPQPTAPVNRQQQPQVRDSSVAIPQPPVLLARPQQVASTVGSMQYPQAHIHDRIDRHLPHMQSHISQQQVNPCLSRQTPGISFQVSGREKQLTLSEHETLLSLINMSNVKVNTGLQSKENPPPVQNQEKPPLNQPKATEAIPKPNDEEKGHQMMKNVNLSSFIGLLRRKAAQAPKDS